MRRLLALSALCGLFSCTDAATVSLSVSLRTDYQPLRDFLSAEVIVGNHAQTARALIDGRYIVPGQPIADFVGLEPSDKLEVAITLLNAQQENIVNMPTRVFIEHHKDTILTVSITRDCRNVSCDDLNGVAQRCLGGKCVPAECVTGNESACPGNVCTNDSECATMSSCAVARCHQNVCFEDANPQASGEPARCPSGFICDIESGCVPEPNACDSAADCTKATMCIDATCIEKLCVYAFKPDDTPCGMGVCQRGTCAALTCNNGELDSGESDIDCGGTCGPCMLGGKCLVDGDCQSNVCDTADSMTCEDVNECGNGKREGSEVCDDGNVVSGDGCTALCLGEKGTSCTDDVQCASGLCEGTCYGQLPVYTKATTIDSEDFFGSAIALDGDTLVVGASGEASCDDGIDANAGDNGCANAGAVYVYRKLSGAWQQEAFIKASNSDAGDLFGYSLALQGDWLIVGARGESSCAISGVTGTTGLESDNGCPGAGAAYVFSRSGTTWTQTEYLKATNSEAGDNFGTSVALEGNSYVIGADGEDSCDVVQSDNSCLSAGAAYKIEIGLTKWVPTFLKAWNAEGGDWFGASVAISNGRVAIGATGEDSCRKNIAVKPTSTSHPPDNNCSASGAVYTFDDHLGLWGPHTYIKASNTDTLDKFGTSLAFEDTTLVVAAGTEQSAATGIDGDEADNTRDGATPPGAVYVYELAPGWTKTAYIKPSNTANVAGFGWGLALSGDELLVGAPIELSCAVGIGGDQLSTGCFAAGSAYLFSRAGGNWVQRAYLKASNTDGGDYFGNKVAIDQGTIVVSAEREESCSSDPSNNMCARAGSFYMWEN